MPAAGPSVRRVRRCSPGPGHDPPHRPGARPGGGRALVARHRCRTGAPSPPPIDAGRAAGAVVRGCHRHLAPHRCRGHPRRHAYLQTMAAWKAYRQHAGPQLAGVPLEGQRRRGLLLSARRARPALSGRTTGRRAGLGDGGQDVGLGLPGVPVHRRRAGTQHHQVPTAGLSVDVALPGDRELPHRHPVPAGPFPPWPWPGWCCSGSGSPSSS